MILSFKHLKKMKGKVRLQNYILAQGKKHRKNK